MIVSRLRQHLDSNDADYEVTKHPEVFTAQEVAAAEHIPGGAMAKTVMLMANDDLVMTVLPGTLMVDLTKASEELGKRDVRLAKEDEFASVFDDCDAGAEPPFGGLYGIPVFVDEHLVADQITFKAGSHTETVTMARADYLELAEPKVIDVAQVVM